MMKKNRKTIYFFFMVLGIGILLGYIMFHPKHSQAEHHTIKTKPSIWTCSMHPQIRQKESGLCPICGMELIPLEETSYDEEVKIKMSSQAMKLANVQTSMVQRGKVEKTIYLNGKVQMDERKIYTQSAHVPGRIEQLMINFTGEYVQKGQAMAWVYSPDLVTAQKELLEAKKMAHSQPALFEAAKEKLKNWKLTDPQIEAFLSSSTIQEDFPILADISGYVNKKMINLGDHAETGQAIYEIIDLSSVWVLFDVYESDASWIHPGDEIDFSISSLPEKKFHAMISYIDPQIHPLTRVAKARVVIDNSSLQLKPEMFSQGEVRSKMKNATRGIVIPESAVLWTGKRSIVYVKVEEEDGIYFQLREISVGLFFNGNYLVESGLKEGEEIATNGTFSIDAAAQLAGKKSMMNAETKHSKPTHHH